MDCIFSIFSEPGLEEIGGHCRNIVTFPEAAPLRETFATSIRVIPFDHYLIFYMTPLNTVRIECIFLSSDYFQPEHVATIAHKTIKDILSFLKSYQKWQTLGDSYYEYLF